MTTEEIHDKLQNMEVPTVYHYHTITKILNLLEAMNSNTLGLERQVMGLAKSIVTRAAAEQSLIAEHKEFMPMVCKWNIWSIPNGVWWKPDGCGYTEDRTQAGAYSYEEALIIMADAHRAAPLSYIPTEAMVPVVV